MNKKILILALATAVLLPTTFVLAAGASDLPSLASNVQTAVEGIGTPIVVIGWIIAGILYLTAGGSPERLGLAKKAMVASVIGTILVVLAAGSEGIITIIKSALGLEQ